MYFGIVSHSFPYWMQRGKVRLGLILYNIQCWKTETWCLLSSSHWHSRIPIYWVACKQQNFIFHSSGGWVIQDQGARRLGICWEPTSKFTDCSLHMCLHMAEQVRELPGISLIRTIIPLMRASPPWHNHLPDSHLQIPSLRVRFQHMNFGRTQTRSNQKATDKKKI